MQGGQIIIGAKDQQRTFLKCPDHLTATTRDTVLLPSVSVCGACSN